MFTKPELRLLKNNSPSSELFKKVNDLNNPYYLKPIELLEEIGFIPDCNANEFRLSIEMAMDSDFCPVKERDNLLYVTDLILSQFLVEDFVGYVANKKIDEYICLDLIIKMMYKNVFNQ